VAASSLPVHGQASVPQSMQAVLLARIGLPLYLVSPQPDARAILLVGINKAPTIQSCLNAASPPAVLPGPDVLADPALDLRERHSGLVPMASSASVVHNGEGAANAG